MDAHRCVHADVPLGYIFYLMFYYIHHIDIDAHYYVHVHVHSGYFFTECLIIHFTAIWMRTSMYTFMCLQIFPYPENFITNITAIWALLSMYTLMNLHTTCVPHYIMTHITAI